MTRRFKRRRRSRFLAFVPSGRGRALKCHLTLCAVTANCSALFIMSAVRSSARPSRSPRSLRAWLAFCTALVTLSAAECSMLLPAGGGERERLL